MHTSITRLRLRSPFTLFPFLRAANACIDQAQASPGFIEGAVLLEGRLVFWTRTVWRSAEAMNAYRVSGVHLKAMPQLLDWCDEAAVAHWEGETLRDWQAIRARLIAQGRLSKVRKPSKAHARGELAAPLKLWTPERPLAPAA